MARRTARPQPTRALELPALTRTCPACGGLLWAAYKNRRTVTTLDGVIRLGVQSRRCRPRDCRQPGRPVRPEPEGRFAVPQHEFGLEVIARGGRLRHAAHRRVPVIHAELVRRGVPLRVRSVGNLLDREDALLALSASDGERRRRITAAAGRVVLARAGLQPAGGHEVLWVLRDALSGAVRLARSLLSSTQDDLVKRWHEVKDALPVPIAGVVSEGQDALRKAVKRALPDVPHQLCQCPDLREAAQPVAAADRPAKVPLTKQVRGLRPLERKVEGRQDDDAAAIRGSGAAVRSAWTEAGRPPLAASGRKLVDRRTAVAARLDRVAVKRGCRRS